MRDPVRGVFRVTGFYDAHPNSSPPGTRITGVIEAPGIPAVPAEHRADQRGRWAGVQQLPVLVDRADPARFAILWAEVEPVSWREQERARAQAAADKLNAGSPPGATGAEDGPGVWDDPLRPQPGAAGGGTTPEQAVSLVHTGQRATGTVLAVAELSPPGLPPGASAADVTFQVQLPDGTSYTAASRIGFSAPDRRARVAVPGAEVPLRVDPADRSRIAVDVAALGFPATPGPR